MIRRCLKSFLVVAYRARPIYRPITNISSYIVLPYIVNVRYENFIFTNDNAERDTEGNVCYSAIYLLICILYLNGKQLADTEHRVLMFISFI